MVATNGALATNSGITHTICKGSRRRKVAMLLAQLTATEEWRKRVH
jgi:hypothetical protein